MENNGRVMRAMGPNLETPAGRRQSRYAIQLATTGTRAATHAANASSGPSSTDRHVEPWAARLELRNQRFQLFYSGQIRCTNDDSKRAPCDETLGLDNHYPVSMPDGDPTAPAKEESEIGAGKQDIDGPTANGAIVCRS